MTDAFNIITGIATSLLAWVFTGILVKVTNESLRTALKYMVTFVTGLALAVLKGLLFNEFTMAEFWINLPAILAYAAAFYGLILKPSTQPES